ncbi:hypothetical protein OIO90_006081 [Microbotryomycetes sp. JL221]|nr:hypothetical protein OIO90_006081 [Microbotryomycetes sp. JL221]
MSTLNMTAFERLNQLTPSPGVSPANGPDQDRNDLTLSFPVSGSELQASLEAWTTRSFNFDADFTDFGNDTADDKHHSGSTIGSGGGNGDKLDGGFNQQLHHKYDTSPSSASTYGRIGGDANTDLDALLHTPAMSTLDTLPGVDEYATSLGTSLVDPALSLPDFNVTMAVPGLMAPLSVLDDAKKSTLASEAPMIAVTTPSTSASTPAESTGSGSVKKPAAPRKRKTPADGSKTADAEEEANRVAVEEDKRKRNTAASARFRMKKKMREAELQQSAKELQDRVAQLEGEVEGLRTENSWLRSLITDKSGVKQLEAARAAAVNCA